MESLPSILLCSSKSSQGSMKLLTFNSFKNTGTRKLIIQPLNRYGNVKAYQITITLNYIIGNFVNWKSFKNNYMTIFILWIFSNSESWGWIGRSHITKNEWINQDNSELLEKSILKGSWHR